jgi:UrcA family protein
MDQRFAEFGTHPAEQGSTDMVPATHEEQAMRTYLANTLFAGVSLAVTAGIVALSSAPVAAAIPTNDLPRAIVRYSDLNLADKAGRTDLEARIQAAAERVCPSSAPVDFDAMACRQKAEEQAHRAIAERLATRSASPNRTAAP